MDHELRKQQADLEEQLLDPWSWLDNKQQLEGWKLNNNKHRPDRYLLEMGKELGAITIPHNKR